MFANRYTAFIDACTLASAYKRNLLLSLAEAEFFRVRWSAEVLEETAAAIAKLLEAKSQPAHQARATADRQVNAMRSAFVEAEIFEYEPFIAVGASLPDPDDAHVLAAALKAQASVIVTENLKDFPTDFLGHLNLDIRNADAFIADTIALDQGKAVAAVKRMRLRFQKPEKTPVQLLLDLESQGLLATVDVLRGHEASL